MAATLPSPLVTAGAHHVPSLLAEVALDGLARAFEKLEDGAPGGRMAIEHLADDPAIVAARNHAAAWLGPDTRVVRILLLDKKPSANWALGWHQDRTIAVRARREVEGFGPWTVKRGIVHVAPPADLHAHMLTARLHLDDTGADNGALMIAPGSHRLGRIAEDEIELVVKRLGSVTNDAATGDVWFYSTPILHASARSQGERRRRVVQIDLAAFDLPGGLEWTG
jgi:hypothetical protein